MRDAQRGNGGDVFVDFGSTTPSCGVTFGAYLDAGSVTLATCRLPSSEGHFIGFSRVTVALHQGGAMEMCWRDPGGERVRSTLIAHGGAMLVDAGVPVWKRWNGPRTIFAFAMDDGFVGQVWRSAFEGVGERTVRTGIGVDDPVVAHLCAVGQRELATGGASGRLFVEGLATALAVHLLQTHGGATRRPEPHKGGLAPARLRRVIEFIEAHVDDEIALRNLAEVAGLSTHHFGETFKASTGRSPYRYVIERRVARAQILLRDEDRPIADVAYTVGFSSQAHLTTNFRRLTGITPGRYRRSLG